MGKLGIERLERLGRLERPGRLERLGDVCTIQSGGTPSRSKKEFWDGGTVPWVKISDFDGIYLDSTEEKITEKGLAQSSAKLFTKGTILYSIFATLGEVCILDIDAATNQAIAGITIKDEEIDQKYLYYFLCSIKPKIMKIGRGVAQNNINLSILRSLEMPIPSLEEQKKMAGVLDAATALATKRRRQLALLDTLTQSRFVEMFGIWPQNNKNWEIGTIKDVVSEVRYGSSRPAVVGGKYPYLRMNNITYTGGLDLTDIKYIDIPDNELDKCTVRKGDVLFNRTNSRELVGKTCVYDRDDMMVLAGFVIRVRVNERVTPLFLSAFLNTDFSKHMLFNMCKNAIGQANINAKELQGIGIYIPPISLQNEFSEFVSEVDRQKAALRRSLTALTTLKSALLQEYFGE